MGHGASSIILPLHWELWQPTGDIKLFSRFSKVSRIVIIIYITYFNIKFNSPNFWLYSLFLAKNNAMYECMIRKTNIKDIKLIHQLLQVYGSKGELLPRPLSELYDHVRDFSVYIDEQKNILAGCCALQFCWEDLAEVRSLAVHPDYIGQGIGTMLVESVLSEAEFFKIKEVFTLTYKPEFFKKFGFKIIDRSKLPLKIWADCILCVKFPDCDETAMVKKII